MRQALLLGLLLPMSADAADAPEMPQKQIAAVLDDWHRAAAEAKLERYFDHFTPGAVFFGTDITERWTRDEFYKYAKPRFDQNKTWNFKAVKRNVFFSKDGNTAWFDEELATPHLGPCRGTGVLTRSGDAWKIAQYHLCVPIPNEVFDQVKKIIEAGAKGTK